MFPITSISVVNASQGPRSNYESFALTELQRKRAREFSSLLPKNQAFTSLASSSLQGANLER